jgi:hypothetical protein
MDECENETGLAPKMRERRGQPRQAVDLTAAIYLIKSVSKVNGHLLDLSLSGCRIRTDARILVDLYTRIEAGFYHLGMPFRVAGVIQAIHARDEVGIRFMDMSERNREKLRGLMEELMEELKEQGTGNRE